MEVHIRSKHCKGLSETNLKLVPGPWKRQRSEVGHGNESYEHGQQHELKYRDPGCATALFACGWPYARPPGLFRAPPRLLCLASPGEVPCGAVDVVKTGGADLQS